MNKVAAAVFAMGHIPFIGVNAALPIIEQANLEGKERAKAIMDISMVLIDKCDALLLIAESPGANRERDLILSKGLPVYFNIDEVPTYAR